MRHIEEDAVIIDGIRDVVLYDQLENLYVAFPLLYRGETPYHVLPVYEIHYVI